MCRASSAFSDVDPAFHTAGAKNWPAGGRSRVGARPSGTARGGAYTSGTKWLRDGVSTNIDGRRCAPPRMVMRSSSSGGASRPNAGSKKAFTARCAVPTQSGSTWSEAGLVGALQPASRVSSYVKGRETR